MLEISSQSQLKETLLSDDEDSLENPKRLLGDRSAPRCFGLNRAVVICCLAASFNTVIGGFSVGGFSGIVYIISKDMTFTMFQTSATVAVLNFAAFFGCFVAGSFCDSHGRLKAFYLSASLFFIGSVITLCSSSFFQIFLGRTVSGLGLGVAYTVLPMYLAEISPGQHRGGIGILKEFAVCLGIVLGYLSSWIFSGYDSSWSWRYMMCIGVILPLLMGVLIAFVMEESPRYLVMRGEYSKARAVLLKLTGDKEEADTTFEDIQKVVDRDTASEDHSVKSLLTRKTTPSVRRMITITAIIAICQHLTAVDGVLSYFPFTLNAAGIRKQEDLFSYQVILGVLKLPLLVPVQYFLDRIGRKPLLLVSAIGVVVAYLIVAYGALTKSANMEIAGLYMFVVVFSIGLGPVTWIVLPELLPLRVRASGMGIAVSLNRLMCCLSETLFLPLITSLSVEFVFACLALLIFFYAVFLHLYLPETKGVKLENIEKKLFQQ